MAHRGTLVLVLLVSWVVGTLGHADDGPFAAWLGTYTNVSVTDSQTTITQAIEQGTSKMGPLRRMVGRSRLKAINQPHKVVRIFEQADHLTIDFDGRRYTAPRNGKPEKGIDPEGKDVTVSFRPDGSTLRGLFVAKDGQKHIDFTLAPKGGELIMQVTIFSDQLPEPIRYSLRYRRKPAALREADAGAAPPERE